MNRADNPWPSSQMKTHEEEYRRVKERARESKKNAALRSGVAREIAQYIVSQLRAFGLSDGALCAWAEIDGYASYTGEIESLQAVGRYRALHDRMWSLARYAGIAHESVGVRRGTTWWKIRSEPLRRANQSVVWAATKEFRSALDLQKKKATPRKPDPIFYETQPYERTSSDARRWV